MPNHLSTLGIIHTAISIIALLAAYYALFRDGKINPANGRGKIYIVLTVITCLTSLPIMKTGHLTAGHYLAVIILVLLPVGIYIKNVRVLGKSAEYLQIIVMSSTLFFSMIPAVVETLTRLPISHPLADGPNSPGVQMGLMGLVVLYFAGVLYQLLKLRSRRKKNTQTPMNDVKLT
jgi:hypothetical protein